MSYKNARVNYKVLVGHMVKKRGKNHTGIKLLDIQKVARENLKLQVSLTQCGWTRMHLITQFKGKIK